MRDRETGLFLSRDKGARRLNSGVKGGKGVGVSMKNGKDMELT